MPLPEVKEWERREHHNRWRAGTICQASRADHWGPLRRKKYLCALRRGTLRQIIGVLSGHCALNKHLQVPCATCIKFGEEPESARHHFGRCGAFYR